MARMEYLQSSYRLAAHGTLVASTTSCHTHAYEVSERLYVWAHRREWLEARIQHCEALWRKPNDMLPSQYQTLRWVCI
jgi:hypothetical protein